MAITSNNYDSSGSSLAITNKKIAMIEILYKVPDLHGHFLQALVYSQEITGKQAYYM